MNIQFDPFQYTFVTIGGFSWIYFYSFIFIFTRFDILFGLFFNWLYSFYNMAYIIKGIEIQSWYIQKARATTTTEATNSENPSYCVYNVYLPPNIIKYANSVNDFNIRRRKSTKAYYCLSQLRNEFI